MVLTTCNGLLESDICYGLCDPNDESARLLMVAEFAAAEEKKETKKLELKIVIGRATALYILHETVQAGHQLNLYQVEDPKVAWENLKPAVTHSTVDDIIMELMAVRVADFASPLKALQKLQWLQNQITTVPGGSQMWSEQQTMRHFISQLRGERYFAFLNSLKIGREFKNSNS